MTFFLPRNKTGHHHPKAKLAPGEADWVRVQHAAGVTKTALAKAKGVDRRVIFRIIYGQSYPDDSA